MKQQKLCMKLIDTKSKRIFQSSYTSKELLSCGFNEAQAGNLDLISRFIESAKSGKDGLKLDVSIKKGDDDDIKEDKGGDNELEEGAGVQGVYITAAAPLHKQPTAVDYAQITITKQDNFFGSMRYTIKLQEIERNEKERNEEIMDEIKNDINVINKKLSVFEQENQSSMVKVAAELVAMKKESEGFAKNEVIKMKEELMASFESKLKVLHEKVIILEKHQMPKGAVIEWNGSTKDIPIGWLFM